MARLLRNRSIFGSGIQLSHTLTRRRVVVTVWILYSLCALAMFAWPGLIGTVSQTCDGQPPFDMRGYWDAADARALVAACGDDGQAAYIRLELLDLIYPLLCGLALLLAAALLVRRLPGRAWTLLLIPAIAMTVLDYSENVAVWTILSTWPTVGDLPAQLGGSATAAKRIAGFAAYLTVPLLLSAALIARVRAARRLADGTPAPAPVQQQRVGAPADPVRAATTPSRP